MANKILIIGTQTREAEIRYSSGEDAMCIARTSMKISRPNSTNDAADYPNVVAFGPVAEVIEKNGAQNKLMLVEGHLQTGSYTDKDNKKVYTTEVVADKVIYISASDAISYNRVMLSSVRLTRDPDIRYSSGENSMCIARGAVACNRRSNSTDGQTADFPNFVAFGRTAEFMEKYCRKGTSINIEGRVQTGSYTDKDNKKVYTTEIVIERVEFAESKTASANNNNTANTSPQPSATVPEDGFVPYVPDDMDLPFN